MGQPPSAVDQASRDSALTTSGSRSTRRWPAIALIAVLAGYLYLYLRSDMPSVPGVGELPHQRWTLLQFCVLLPDQMFSIWFGDPPQPSFADRVPILGAALGIVLVCAMLGRALLSLIRADVGLSLMERFSFSLGLGLNAASLYVLATGLAGLLHQRLVYFVPGGLIAAIWLWRQMPSQRMPARPKSQAPSAHPGGPDPSDWVAPQWLWLIVPLVAVIVLGGVLPPYEFDVREYHLQAPKEFFQQGKIGFMPHNVYANMPLGTEMLGLLAMVVLDDWWYGALVGKSIGSFYALATALVILAMGRRFFSPSAGIVGAICYLCIPWVVLISTSGLVEGASAFYLMSALYAVLLARQAQTAGDPSSMPRFALAGLLAGAAVSCKYPAVLFVVLPLASWILLNWRRGARGGSTPPESNESSNMLPGTTTAERSSIWLENLRAAILFVVCVLASCGLWLGKNWVLTGNPTYPLLAEYFGGATRTPEKIAQWDRVHKPHEWSSQRLLESLAQVAWRSEWHSPVLMPLAAFAFFAARRRGLTWLLFGYFAVVIASWWLFTHRIDRFWVPVLPVVCLLAGVGATCAWGSLWRCTVLMSLVAAASVCMLFVTRGEDGANYCAYLVPLDRLRTNMERVDRWHVAINDIARDSKSVLLVGEAEVFDIEVPIRYSTVFDDCVFESMFRGKTPAEVHKLLAEKGIEYIFVNWGEIARYRRPGNYGFTDFVQKDLFRELLDAGVLGAAYGIPLNPCELYPVLPLKAVKPKRSKE